MRHISISLAAQVMRVSEAQIRRWTNRGLLHARSSPPLYDWSELLRFADPSPEGAVMTDLADTGSWPYLAVTYLEAASCLGVTPKVVRGLLEDGVLRKVPETRRTLITAACIVNVAGLGGCSSHYPLHWPTAS